MRIDDRSIFGYFTDRQDAERAQEQLRSAGFDQTHLDALRHGDRIDAPLTMGVDSGTDVGDDTGVLLGADPAASGLAAPDEAPVGKAWLVVALTDGSDEKVERAVKILKRYGGDV